MSDQKSKFIHDEQAAYAELHALVEGLTDAQLDEPGYTSEWSAKDMLAHIACWCAEAARHLEQMRLGTYRLTRDEERGLIRDLDAINARFYEACRDQSPRDVRAELAAARTRMLEQWDRLPEVTKSAAGWFRTSGPEHYAEHIPRLKEWVAELRRA